MQVAQHHIAEQRAELVLKALKYVLSKNPAVLATLPLSI